MTVLTATRQDALLLDSRLRDDSPLLVVSLCADWCTTCKEFRATFERIAATRTDALFVWLDVEDDHEICGDVDVENFPTLAVYRGNAPLHYGVALPHESSVARLVDELARRTSGNADIPAAVAALPHNFRRVV